MNKIKLILGASLLLIASVQVNAAIINATNTNTEYATGSFANLQGLEWLSLEITTALVGLVGFGNRRKTA